MRGGGEELEMAVSVLVCILGMRCSPDPAASGSEETLCCKKKLSPARNLCSVEHIWVWWRRRIVPKGVGHIRVCCDKVQLSAARTQRYARGLKCLHLVNAQGEALGFVIVCEVGVFGFFPLFFLPETNTSVD